MRKILLVSLFVAVNFVYSCAHKADEDKVNFLIPYFPDILDTNTKVPEEHPCDPNTILTDFYNCGVCGNACVKEYSDACVNGQCVCGNMENCEAKTECLSPNEPCECRIGVCIQRDPNGDICEFDDECAGYYGSVNYLCIQGKCTYMECVPEECDGYDNDCDEKIDEANNGMPLSEWCFSGTAEQLIEPCRAGARMCLPDGVWSSCYGEVSPVAETGLLNCDGEDNNCDGCIDGNWVEGNCVQEEQSNFDVLFVVDISGSMVSTIVAVVEATNNFSESFANFLSYRFALAVFPVSDRTDYSDSHTDVVTDFTDLESFQRHLDSITANADSPNEPNWDAGYEIGMEELQPLSWRDDAVRVVIIYTDEPGQSYRDPEVNEQDMCEAFTRGEVVAFFTEADSVYDSNIEDFDECGMRFDIADEATMLDSLETIIDDPC